MNNRLKKIHAWAFQWVNTKWGPVALFVFAFADASFLPLPTPMFFLALVLLNISKAYKFALYGTFGTLLGAVAGYAIGHYAWINSSGESTRLAQFVINNIPGFSEDIYKQIQFQFTKWNFWILFIAAYIPVPYKIFAISSGVFDINIAMFIIATFIGQGIRYYLFAMLIVKLGPEVKKLLDFKLKPVAIVAAVCLVLVAVVVVRVIS